MLHRLVEYSTNAENVFRNKDIFHTFNGRIKSFYTSNHRLINIHFDVFRGQKVDISKKQFFELNQAFLNTTAFRRIGLPQIDRKIVYFQKNDL